MRCNKCGEKLRTGDSYCPICGEKYVEPEKAIPKRTKIYPNFDGWIILVLEICLALGCGVIFALTPYMIAKVIFKSPYCILIGAIAFIIPVIVFVRLFASTFDTLEVVDGGERIKITKAWGKKTQFYDIKSISCVTDGLNTPRQRYNFKRPLMVLSKNDRILFTIINTKETRTLFEYYGVDVRIYHGN